MKILIFSVVFTCIVVVTYLIWSVLTFRRTLREEKKLNDSRYYELRSKNEFLLACFATFVAVFSFMGYNSMNDLKESFKEEIDKSLSQAKDSLSVAIAKASESHQMANSTANQFKELNGQYEYLLKSANGLRSSIDVVHLDLGKITEKGILNKDFFIISDLVLTNNEVYGTSGPRRFYFNKLQTKDQELLPAFNTVPTVFILPTKGTNPYIVSVTNEYVDISAEAGPLGVVVAYDDQPLIHFNMIVYQ